MTGRGVSDPDMPNFPWRPSGSVPPAGDGALDELLATGQPPQDAAPGLLPVAEVLAALRAGPSGRELAGTARALAEFREAAVTSHRSRRILPRRTGVLRTRVSAKLAAAGATAAVAIAGTAAAAYFGAVPGSLQSGAHQAKETGTARPTPTASAVGPAATGAATFALCGAYRHGSAPQRAVAARTLAKTVGGPRNVASFCASAPRPRAVQGGPGAEQLRLRMERAAHAAGKRSAHPDGKHPAHHPGERFPGSPRGQFAYPFGERFSHQVAQRSAHQARERSARPSGMGAVGPSPRSFSPASRERFSLRSAATIPGPPVRPVRPGLRVLNRGLGSLPPGGSEPAVSLANVPSGQGRLTPSAQEMAGPGGHRVWLAVPGPTGTLSQTISSPGGFA